MLVSLILTSISIILLYQIFQKWRVYRKMWSHAIHLPGPKGVPVLGNIPTLLRALNNNMLREERLKDCLKYKHIHRYYTFEKITVMVYNPQDLETILSSMKLITKGQPYEIIKQWLGTGLLTSTGSKWQYRRKVLTPAFHFSILQEFLEVFNKETENLIKNLKQHVNKPINVVKPITEFTLSSIGETSLGVEINEDKNCVQYKKAVYDFGDILMTISFQPWLEFPIIKQLHPVAKRLTNAIGILHDFSKNIIQKRKKQIEGSSSYSTNKRLALLDLLLRARSKEGINIDDEGIREEVDTFMFEGHDTTSMSLCYTLMAFANEQKIQEEIYQEVMDIMGDSKKYPDFNDLSNMTFMERCIKESLRLYPSVPNIVRRMTEDVKTKDGYIIPEGADVEIAIFELHRMPHLWENPEKFDPDRFLPENISTRHPFSYIPFSAGPRNCIGQKFAMLELKAAVCGILRAFKLEPVTKYSDLRYKVDMVLRPYGELQVLFKPRHTKP